MKRKTNRILSLLLALIMCVGVLTACGGDTSAQKDPAPPANTDTDKAPDTQPSEPSEPAGPDISKAVTLTMYLIGDRPVDNDEVLRRSTSA